MRNIYSCFIERASSTGTFPGVYDGTSAVDESRHRIPGASVGQPITLISTAPAKAAHAAW